MIGVGSFKGLILIVLRIFNIINKQMFLLLLLT